MSHLSTSQNARVHCCSTLGDLPLFDAWPRPARGSYRPTGRLSTSAFARAGLRASALPNILAVNVRFTKASTNASMKRLVLNTKLLRDGASQFDKQCLSPGHQHDVDPRRCDLPRKFSADS